MKNTHKGRAALVSIIIVSGFAASLAAAEAPDYTVADPELKVVRLDSAPTESFLAVKADTTGRLFVGGREALFVYEPNATGGYEPRRQLLSFPNHTWVYDIEIRGDDLYILTVSALYLIPEGRIKREGLQVRRLIWGVPMGHVHQCFHGLTWGPEGDLYFCMGDPLTYYGDFNRPDHWGYWTFFSRPGETRAASGAAKRQASGDALKKDEWVKTPYNGVGGVFRCKPDGSGFQVVATGLRNNCGLVFDRDWNLFTNDNDHESIPADYVPGRLNHVVPHAYFSWPRGWMPSKTPDRLDLLETMNTKLGRFVPVGQSYYDDTYLPAKYRNSLLVARWCTRQITYYPLQHHGATFKCDEHELLAGRDLARPVHVTVGRGGRLFASVCYMAHNEGSPVYKSDLVMITRADDTDAHPFDAYDAPTATKEKLFDELSNPSWSRRLAAHVELSRRGSEAGQRLAGLSGTKLSASVVNHLLWLAASQGMRQSAADWMKLADHASAAVRLNSIRAVNEFIPGDAALETIIRAGNDSDPQVRLASILALFGRDGWSLPKQNNPTGRMALSRRISDLGDSYLRQAAAMLMAEHASVDTIGNDLQSGTADERLLAVLAAGFRLTMPPVHQVVSDDLPLAPWRNLEEAMKIHFIDGEVDLRDWGRSGLYTVAEHWKAGKHSEDQEQLFALLAARLGDPDEKVRLQAAYFLSLLNDERTEPVIARVRTDIQKSRLATAPIMGVGTLWAVGPFVDEKRGFTTIHPPEHGPFDPSAKYSVVANRSLAWKQIKQFEGRYFDFREVLGSAPGSSCYVATRIESGTKQQIQLLPGTDAGFKIWLNGKFIHRSDAIRGALPFQDVVPLDLEPGSNDLLIRIRDEGDACRLYLHARNLQPVAFVLPQPLEGGTLADRLKEAATNPEQTKIDARFLSVDWNEAVKLGNPAHGKKLFSADGLGCAKCHAVTIDSATTGGPSLAEAAKRFTVAHLVESVLLPNETISPVFKATLIQTKQGKTFTGLVIADTAEKLEMIQTDTSRVTIPAADVEERKLQDVSPMPAGLVKTPDELRDLLAYLLRGEG